MITGLDHVVVAVPDLAEATASYAAFLGRAPAWLAAASGGGAEIAVFRLDNVAVELMAPAGGGEGGDRLRAALAADGPGLASLAFAVDDVERAARRLARVGLDPEPVADGESVDRESGRRRAWRRTRASSAATHGVRIFLLEPAPLAPSPLRAPAESAMTGLDHVVIRTPDPDRAAALYGARLGLDLRLDRSSAEWGARLLFFRCGDLVVEIAHDLKAGVSDAKDRLWGLSWRVPDAAAARGRLHAAGFDVSELRPGRRPGTRVFTVRDRTCGVPTLVLEPPAPRA